jgi:hypothetical protein
MKKILLILALVFAFGLTHAHAKDENYLEIGGIEISGNKEVYSELILGCEEFYPSFLNIGSYRVSRKGENTTNFGKVKAKCLETKTESEPEVYMLRISLADNGFFSEDLELDDKGLTGEEITDVRIKKFVENQVKIINDNYAKSSKCNFYQCLSGSPSRQKSCLTVLNNKQKNDKQGLSCKKIINKELLKLPAIITNTSSIRSSESLVSARLDKGISKERNLRKLIIDWTNFILPFAAIVAVIALVWAGFIYITAMEDEGRIDTAKNIIKWVVIGILLTGGAYAIVATLISGIVSQDIL